MIHGLFLDPRAWQIDFLASPFWRPERHGVSIDLHNDAFSIPKTGVDKKYKFVIATEVWEIPMRNALKYLRNKGLKIFLAAREPIKYGELIDAMFSYERFNVGGEYYFTPDAVLAAGKEYARLWEDKTKTYVTGYPRWDFYADHTKWLSKPKVAQKYGLNKDSKWIFFPSYPPYHYKKVDGKDIMIDLFDSREQTIAALARFAESKNGKYQVVIKIHPASMKPFLKGTGTGKEVAGLLKQYYESPTDNIKVIGDVRTSGDISREIMVTSEAVVGYNSTMLLEAAHLRKPTVQVLIGSGATVTSPYEGMFEVATTGEALIDLLNIYDGVPAKLISTKLDKVEAYINNIDGGACQRMCEAIKQEVK